MQAKIILIAAALSAVTLSAASAGSATSHVGYVAPGTDDETTRGAVASPDQENAIPYHPCRLALGWRNGHLVCDNRS